MPLRRLYFHFTYTASDGELSSVVPSTITVTEATGFKHTDLSSIMVYQNPANDRLFVDFTDLKMATARIKIVDITGKVVYDESHYDPQVEIGLGDLKQGMYFMNISIGEQITVRKLSIVK